MLQDLKIHQLRCVLTILEQGGFHAAARRLNRTQPALSMAVKELEQRLGHSLFEKKGGKATLTPFGIWCVPRFRELVDQHDRLSRNAMAVAEMKSGHVDIAAVPSVASRLMPRILAEFVSDYPGVEISLHDGNADFVKLMVQKGEAEIGLTSLWQAEPALDFITLLQDTIGVVCRDDHPLARRENIEWQELLGEPLIRNGTSRLLEGSEAAELLTSSSLYISNMISLTAMLEAGIGITTLPQLAFQEEHVSLRFLPLSRPHLERRIGLLQRSGISLSPAATAMQRYIIKHLTGGTKGPEDAWRESRSSR